MGRMQRTRTTVHATSPLFMGMLGQMSKSFLHLVLTEISPNGVFRYGDVTLCNAFWEAPLNGTDSQGGTLVHVVSSTIFRERRETTDMYDTGKLLLPERRHLGLHLRPRGRDRTRPNHPRRCHRERRQLRGKPSLLPSIKL